MVAETAPRPDLPSLRFRALTPEQVADLRDWWEDAVAEAIPSYEHIEADLLASLPWIAERGEPMQPVCKAAEYTSIRAVFILPRAVSVDLADVVVLGAACEATWRVRAEGYEFDRAGEKRDIRCQRRFPTGGPATLEQLGDPETWRKWIGDGPVCRSEHLVVRVVMPGE
jgi:hypothetical protein